MRITQHGMIQRVITNVQNRLNRVSTVQDQMTTGLRVNRPSDDPSSAAQILNLESVTSRDQQYKRNIENAEGSLRLTEEVINQIYGIISTVRSDAVRGANEALGEDGLHSIAEETNQNMRMILQEVNQRYQNRYLFGGTNANDEPYRFAEDENGWFTEIEPNTETAPNDIEIIVADGQRLESTITYDSVLDMGNGETVFDLMFELRDALEADDSEAVSAMIDRIDGMMDILSSATSLIGTRVQTIQSLIEGIDTKEIIYTERVSNLADVDIVEAITHYQEEQNAYEIALKIAADAIQPSLVNFISF